MCISIYIYAYIYSIYIKTIIIIIIMIRRKIIIIRYNHIFESSERNALLGSWVSEAAPSESGGHGDRQNGGRFRVRTERALRVSPLHTDVPIFLFRTITTHFFSSGRIRRLLLRRMWASVVFCHVRGNAEGKVHFRCGGNALPFLLGYGRGRPLSAVFNFQRKRRIK